MTNKKERKTLRKTLSLTLAMLVSILGLPLAKPQQVSATETSNPKYLSKVTIDATADTDTLWENNYDTKLYNTLTGSGYDNSYKTAETALKIGSAEELAAFARAVNVGKKNFKDRYVQLINDIDLKGGTPVVTQGDYSTDSNSKFNITVTNPVGEDGKAIPIKNVWTPIGNSSTNFRGTFDGGNWEISNMTVLANSTSSDVYAGLFGYIYGESIKDTGVTGNVYASSSSSSSSSDSCVYAGGLVGYGNSYTGVSIINSYATGNVYASSSSSDSDSSKVYAGGLVGRSDSVMSMSNSYATGNVYASSASGSYAYVYAGGLVGRIDCYNDMSISNSYATGNAYASSSESYASAGGLVGRSIRGSGGSGSATISNSYATGDAYAYSPSKGADAGGLLGESSGGSGSATISNSYATGDAYAYSAGSYYSASAGGLVGTSSGGSISNSYATGNAYASSAESAYAGGLLSWSDSSISNSYATGNVYASSSDSSASVYAGGLVGKKNSGSITNGYYYSGATIGGGTGATISENGKGLTMDEMTGTGEGRARNTMTGFTTNNWLFQKDEIRFKYLPRLKVITYNEETNPVPRFAFPAASDFDFKSPANLTYNGELKEAEVTAKSGIKGMGKITVKYYNSAGTNLTSAPTNAGTYTVKIDVAEGDNYEAQTDITADNWTFTIAKANPTIKSIATSVTYKPGLTLKDVPYPSILGTEGSWAWSNSSTAISGAGTYTYKAIYTPNNTTNYNSVTEYITVTVNKADPTIGSTSTTATYKPGLTLAKVSHPSISETSGSWTWLNSSIPISSAGAHYFEAKFKPTNTNYNEVTKCILVTVNKATLQASDFKFAAPSNLEYSADYKIASVTPKSEIMGMSYPTVKYFTKVNGELTLLEDSSGKLLIPTDVGTYYVGTDVSEDINYNSAKGLTSDSWNFTITPAGKHTYQLADESRVYLVTK